MCVKSRLFVTISAFACTSLVLCSVSFAADQCVVDAKAIRKAAKTEEDTRHEGVVEEYEGAYDDAIRDCKVPPAVRECRVGCNEKAEEDLAPVDAAFAKAKSDAIAAFVEARRGCLGTKRFCGMDVTCITCMFKARTAKVTAFQKAGKDYRGGQQVVRKELRTCRTNCANATPTPTPGA